MEIKPISPKANENIEVEYKVIGIDGDKVLYKKAIDDEKKKQNQMAINAFNLEDDYDLYRKFIIVNEKLMVIKNESFNRYNQVVNKNEYVSESEYSDWPDIRKGDYYQSMISYAEDQAFVKTFDIGPWGARCTCPNGMIYQVGSTDKAGCENLDCHGGAIGKCRQKAVPWLYSRVVCGEEKIGLGLDKHDEMKSGNITSIDLCIYASDSMKRSTMNAVNSKLPKVDVFSKSEYHLGGVVIDFKLILSE